MDLAHLYSEKQLEKIEKRFAKEYKQAEKEVSAKLKAYLDGFAKREAKMLEKVANGEISYQRYTQWRIGQVAVGERWKKLRDELAEAYTNATVRNTQDIEAMLEDIFAESANRTMFSIERGANVDTSFTLYDQNTVNRLIEEQPNLLPKPRVKIAKDKKWNQKKITSAVTQGILQGDSMGQIAKRMRGEISKGFSIEDVKDWQSKPMDKAMKELSRKISQSAIRNARTAVTGAENAGRLQGYEDAKDMGIKLQQQWVATLDNRTRHEHRELDGQIRGVEEPFEVDGDEIMYPADPNAEPHLVYNCRCTTIAVIDGHPIDLDVRDTSVIGDYEEWKHGKKSTPPQKSQKPLTAEQLQKETSDTLRNAYSTHRDINKLNNVRAEDVPDKFFYVNYGKMSKETAQAINTAIKNLTEYYDTPLNTIRIWDRREALGRRSAFAFTFHNYETDVATIVINPAKCGDFNKMAERIRELINSGYSAKINDELIGEYIITHEFAHTLVDMGSKLDKKRNWVGADYAKTESVRKEINAVYDEYLKEVSALEKGYKSAELEYIMGNESARKTALETKKKYEQARISLYAGANADEFMAEAFAHARLGGADNKYVNQVMKILDKNYRRKK